MAHFSRYFKVKDNCTSCGWCAKNCPRGNLYIQNNKLIFGNGCVGCFRCIYGCPNKSICFQKGKRIVLKNGYNIDEVEKRMQGVPLEPVNKCCKGLWAIGVKKYLLENE
ncbi:4Fe-4S binding protein [Pseudobacteroides cellulosolvens]|uniref:4Fe-4S binding protein n=1 Tax=Pseudobacteroides cellulosolvens TaxID=35825 RepID=UPI00068CABFC|nr:4Fe-4S binding protein [Pseudobacteroides cellulosolvens]